MNLKSIQTFILAVSAFTIAHAASASVIRLSGKIVDSSGKPVPDVELYLQTAKLSSTTNSQGTWSFSRGTSTILRSSLNSASESSRFEFDLKGRIVGFNHAKGLAISNSNTVILSKSSAAEDTLIVTYKDNEIAHIPVPDLDAGPQANLVLGKYSIQFSPAEAGTSSSGFAILGFPTVANFTYDASLWNLVRVAINGTTAKAEEDFVGLTPSANNTVISIALQSRKQELEFAKIESKIYGDIFTVSPIISSGLPVSVVSETKSICTVSGSIISTIGVGTCKITASQTGNDSFNSIAASQSFSVSKKTLTIANLKVNDKVYDGTTKATANGTLSGIVGDDDVALTLGTATFADKLAGKNKKVSLQGTKITGKDVAFYTLSATPALTASITPKMLITTNVKVGSKTYDRNDSVYDISAELSGIISGDEVLPKMNDCSFSNYHAGTWNISCTGNELTGKDAANYTRSKTGSVRGTILPKTITYTAEVNAQGYGNGTSTLVGQATPIGLLPDDSYMRIIPGTANFTSIYAGTDIPVTVVGSTIENNWYGDYVLKEPTLKGNIFKMPLTIAPYEQEKLYGDELTETQYHWYFLNATGLVNGDVIESITVSSPGGDATAGVGTYQVTATSAKGTNLENYDITWGSRPLYVQRRSITVSGQDASMTYGDVLDLQQTPEVVSGSLVNGDQIQGFTANCTGALFAGTYPINFSNAVGTGLQNYSISYQPKTLTVNKRPIQISAIANAPSLTKVYNGTAVFPTTGVLGGMHYTITNNLGFLLIPNFTSAVASQPDAGATTVTLSYDATLTGSNASNFSIAPGTLQVTGTITPKPLNYTINDKVYDGTTATTVSFTGVLSGDDAIPSASASFGDPNAGTNKGVTILNFAVSGADGVNYKLGAGNSTANITPAAGTITFSPPPSPVNLKNSVSPIPLYVTTTPATLALSYTSSTPNVCNVDAFGVVTFPSTNGNYESGTCTITANSGSTNYTASASQSFTVYGILHTGRSGEQDYRTTKIENRTWMAENMKYQTASENSFCPSIDYCNTYGVLYNQEEAIATCPIGWHVPAIEEFPLNIPSAKLKANSPLWEDSPGTDDFGFSVLPGGYYFGNTVAYRIYAGVLITSSKADATTYNIVNVLDATSNSAVLANYMVRASLRCVRNN